MDTQTQIERLIELAIIQRSELKRLVDELPQLREHLSSEIEKTFEDAEPQLRAELEEFIEKRATDATAKTGAALEAKIKELSSNLEISTQARFNAIIAEREQNARLAAEAEAKIAEHAASLPSAVKEIVSAELARFPRAGEIDQLRKEFAEPRGLNPRGKWQAGESYNKLDLVTINGDSYTSNTDGNRTRPSRSSADWTLVAARGTGGGGGPTSLSELTTVPSDGDLLIGSGTSWVTSNLTAGAGISITVGPGAITISATDGDITLDDGTAASPSLHFTNDPDTGIYRPAANTLGISVSGTQVAYFDEDGLTIPNAGVVAGGSFHGANGNANNPSFSFTSDQDTGFYRHGTNELGISIGGTEKAVMTSTTFSITPNVSTSGNLTVSGNISLTSNTSLIQFPSTTDVPKVQLFSNTYGLGIDNTDAVFFAGSGGGIRFKADSVSGTQWGRINGSGLSLTGNLTVSGTGNSSFGGNVVVANTVDGIGFWALSAIGGDHRFSLTRYDGVESGSALLSAFGGINFMYNATSSRTSGTVGMVLNNSGKLLIGKTTPDTGERLQVSGDISMTNGSGNGTLTVTNNAGKSAFVQAAGSTAYLGSGVAGMSCAIVSGNGATALTLDSSQNATFAGKMLQSGPSTLDTAKQIVIKGAAGATTDTTITHASSYGTVAVRILYSLYNTSTGANCVVEELIGGVSAFNGVQSGPTVVHTYDFGTSTGSVATWSFQSIGNNSFVLRCVAPANMQVGARVEVIGYNV